MWLKLIVMLIFLPIIISFIILCVTKKLYNNGKIKLSLLNILGIGYNSILAFISPYLLINLLLLLGTIGNYKISFFILFLIIISIILPLNIYIIKKDKKKSIIYIIVNIVLYVMIFMYPLTLMRSNIDL